MDDRHVLKGALAACLVAAVAACQADGSSRAGRSDATQSEPPAASGRSSERPTGADAPAGNDRPTGSTGQPAGSGSTEGPHEGRRGSIPPGTSRDGLPPVGGAIVDPSGAVTGTPPPSGTR